jgi:predicted CoA-binding protein
MMNLIEQYGSADDEKFFLDSRCFAVAGASTNRDKYGNKVVRVYLQNGKKVIPINPKAESVEGIKAVKSVEELPEEVDAMSIVTPGPVTAKIMEAALNRGIKKFWIQPGAENQDAIKKARSSGAAVISDGPCILVAMGYRE